MDCRYKHEKYCSIRTCVESMTECNYGEWYCKKYDEDKYKRDQQSEKIIEMTLEELVTFAEAILQTKVKVVDKK